MTRRVFRYPARRGDTLADLAREFRVARSVLESLNPYLDGTSPVPAGREVLLPLPEGSRRVRLDATGPLVVHARARLRVLLHEKGLEGAILPLYSYRESPDLRLRIRIDRLLAAVTGTVQGVAFLTDDREDPFRSLPVRSYAGEVVRGSPPTSPVPRAAEIREDLLGRGLKILRVFEEPRPEEVTLPLSLSDLRDALGDCRDPRIRVFCTDGFACDTDRTSRLGILRLLVEARVRKPRTGRSLLSLECPGMVQPEAVGGQRLSVVDGEEATEVLPCPLAGKIRVTLRRSGVLRRCVEGGDLTLEFLSDLAPTEEQVFSLFVYVRQGGEGDPLYEVCPERRSVPAGTWEREKKRISVEEGRILLLFDRGASGLRLAEAWIDGTRRK